jgi:uncharacterized membrane protein YkvA (DUF1232 family)
MDDGNARPTPNDDFARVYSDRALWEKLGRFAAQAGKKVLWNALVLYYCLMDPDTPREAKVVIAGALGYFIMPLDAISDFFPGGFADDLGALVAALGLVKAHVKAEHRRQAEAKLQRWFGDD